MSSNSEEPPKRTLLGIESGDEPATSAPTSSAPVVIPKELESTLPMGSTSLRQSLDAALAAGPAAAQAAFEAARRGEDPAATAKMGSAAIQQTANKGPLAFTAKGTAPSTHDLAEAIAKAANAHAQAQVEASRQSANQIDPTRKQTKPGTDPPANNPARGATTSPYGAGAPDPYGAAATTNPYGSPDVQRPMALGGPSTPAQPVSQESMFARPKPPTGPAPQAFAPQSDPRNRPPTGPNPNAPFAPAIQAGSNPQIDPRNRPPTGPNPNAFAPAQGSIGNDPTALNMPAPVIPGRAQGHDPTALNMQAPRMVAPNPLAVSTAQGYGAHDRQKPPTGPSPAVDPNAFAAKPGSNPNAYAYDPGRPSGNPIPVADPSKPGSGPHPFDPNRAPSSPIPVVAAIPGSGPHPYDGPRIRPPTNPNPAAFPQHDATMMASPASQLGVAERPRVSTENIKPIAESLREVANDHYEVKDEIARGGMGRILRAHDVRLRRQVAIKELIGNDAGFKARFERETLITARLQHPAIVPIYDAGRWPTGELFYSMKLVAGKPLETLINNVGGMRERLALLPNLIAVAEALAYAHSNGVVHRDLKPANILVGDFGETIVIDWGLAKDFTTNDVAEPAGPFRTPAVGAAGATVAGSVMGTPAYMPVEQGRGLQVDARADVYAIGAVLYHVLSKRAPYEGPDGMTILQALLKDPPVPLTELAPDVPRELATIVAKAMAREAEHRYPTARELVEDLRRYQAGQMVGVHRYTSRELFKRWAKKHKGALTVATFAFVALVVIGIIAISRVVAANREAQHEAAVALEQTDAAQKALTRAEASEARAKKSEQTAAEERDRQRFARERRVEFDHFAHTQRVSKCAECHPTDPKTFTALAGHPGHGECQGCHEPKSMEGLSNDPKCAFCHIDRVATTKDHVSLRACDDGSMRAIKAAGGKIGPCFRHDAKAHRFADDGKPLECTTCHAVLADKSKWGSKSYKSLTDLDTNTIIGQGPAGGTDAMHKACSTGCHAHEAQTSIGNSKAACAMCHPDRGAF